MIFEPIASAAKSQPLLALILGSTIWLLSRSIHRIYYHQLSHIPGPYLPKITSLWLHYHAYIGDEASTIHLLHTKYGSVVRVAPNEVDISDADAIHPIYVSKGGFSKASCYANFDIDGHKTIFSTTSGAYRALRAKAVMTLFSTKSIRDNSEAIYACVDRMVERLSTEAKTGRPVNLLNLTRSLAVDVVSTHHFQDNYDGVSEKGQTLSVSAFVDAFVSVGRFFYLPNFVFTWLEWATDKCTSSQHTAESMALVDGFVAHLVNATGGKSSTYQSRLLAAGLNKSEVKAQCKDLIFAGTDSTGMNLATIIRCLVLHPTKYDRLRKEVLSNLTRGPHGADIQALPYLSAIVKEGLRISMANPTRLPHIVPRGGWTFKDTCFSAGSVVGCSAYELHNNLSVFSNSKAFLPERWLEDEVTEEMNKHWFAFGAGSRACIARNLAMTELYFATERVASSGVLNGAKAVQQGEIEIFEWFNSKVKDERIELVWN